MRRRKLIVRAVTYALPVVRADVPGDHRPRDVVVDVTALPPRRSAHWRSLQACGTTMPPLGGEACSAGSHDVRRRARLIRWPTPRRNRRQRRGPPALPGLCTDRFGRRIEACGRRRVPLVTASLVRMKRRAPRVDTAGTIRWMGPAGWASSAVADGRTKWSRSSEISRRRFTSPARAQKNGRSPATRSGPTTGDSWVASGASRRWRATRGTASLGLQESADVFGA